MRELIQKPIVLSDGTVIGNWLHLVDEDGHIQSTKTLRRAEHILIDGIEYVVEAVDSDGSFETVLAA